jgi:hypothetical protein
MCFLPCSSMLSIFISLIKILQSPCTVGSASYKLHPLNFHPTSTSGLSRSTNHTSQPLSVRVNLLDSTCLASLLDFPFHAAHDLFAYLFTSLALCPFPSATHALLCTHPDQFRPLRSGQSRRCAPPIRHPSGHSGSNHIGETPRSSTECAPLDQLSRILELRALFNLPSSCSSFLFLSIFPHTHLKALHP